MNEAGREQLKRAHLAVITDTQRARGRSLDTQVRLATMGGADVIMLRAPELSPDVYAGVVRRLRPMIPGGILPVVYDHPGLAVALNAAVQLGKEDAPVAEVRKKFPRLVMGYSAHALEEAAQAAQDGADFVLLSLLFPTTKDAVPRPPLPPDVWPRAMALPVPVFALGGVTAAVLPQAMGWGVRRVAVCGAVLGSENPVGQLASIKGALNAPPPPAPATPGLA